MEVFLIPVGGEAYELYCEVADDTDVTDAHPPRGMFGRLVQRFRATLAEAERERHRAPEHHESHPKRSWYTRLMRGVLRRIAESIAEQRLLWHVRRQSAAVAVHPDDLPPGAAMGVVRRSMQADVDKHRKWLAIDSVIFVASGVLMILPGPNILAYYFGFRVVGHYLSMRGAQQALRSVVWTTRASAPLTALRATIDLDPDQRDARVHDIAARLGLERLAAFFRRTAIPRA